VAREYFDPSLADHLPMSRRALRGFRRLAPCGSRAPLPFVGPMILVGCAMSRHAPLMAIAYLLKVYAYLRPYELFSLKATPIIRPTSQAWGTWGLLLPPSKHARASTTGRLDESVLVDCTGVPATGRALEARVKTLQATPTMILLLVLVFLAKDNYPKSYLLVLALLAKDNYPESYVISADVVACAPRGIKRRLDVLTRSA
jgi:hypothetical protein